MTKQSVAQQINASIRWRLAKVTGDEKWIKTKQKKQVVRDSLTKEEVKERIDYLDKSGRRVLKYALTDTEIYGLSVLFDRFAEDGQLDLEGFLQLCLLQREKLSSPSTKAWMKKEKQFIADVMRLFEHACVRAEMDRDESLKPFGMEAMELHEFLLMFSFWKLQSNAQETLKLDLADFYFHLFDVNKQGKLARVDFVCALRCLFVATGYVYMDKHLFPERAKKARLNFFQQKALGGSAILKPLRWNDFPKYNRHDLLERARHEKALQGYLDDFKPSYKLATFKAFCGFVFEEMDILQRGFVLMEDMVLWLQSNASVLRTWQGGVSYSDFSSYFKKYGVRLYDHEFTLFAQDVHMFSHFLGEELEVKFHEFGIKIAEKLELHGETTLSRREFKKWLMLHKSDEFKLSYERVAASIMQRMQPLVKFAPEFLNAVLKQATNDALGQLKHRATVAKLTKIPLHPTKPPKPLRNLLVEAENIGTHFELRIVPIRPHATGGRSSTKRSPTLGKMLKMKTANALSRNLLK